MHTSYVHRPYNMQDKAGHYTIAQLSGLKPCIICVGCCSMQCNCAEGLHSSAFHYNNNNNSSDPEGVFTV